MRARRLLDGLFFAIVLWLGIGLATSNASASTPVVVTQTNNEYRPGSSLTYYEDPSGKLSLDDILGGGPTIEFQPSPAEVPNFGFSESAYWFSFEVDNASAEETQWLIGVDYPLLDVIDLYQIEDGKRGREYHTGDDLRFYSRPIDHPTFVFPLDLKPNQRIRILIRIQSTGAVKLPLTIYQSHWFWEQDLPTRVFNGILAGIMVVMTLYNLFVFIALRAPVYILYVLFGTCSLGFQNSLNGFAFQFLWPQSTWLAAHSFLISSTLMGVFLILFSIRFLALPVWTPRIFKLLTVGAWYFGLLFVASFFAPYRIVILCLVPAALVCLPILFIAGLTRLKQGSQEAQYFTLAFIALILGVFAFALSAAGLLPANVFTTQSHQVGVVLQVVLLSMALARKLKVLQDQNIAFQMQTAEDLEREVEARTHELEVKTLEAHEASLVAMNAMDLSEKLRVIAEQNEADAEKSRVEALGLRAQAEKHAEELAEVDKQKTAFFQNVSHELRTPLTLILNPLDHQCEAQPDNHDIHVAAKNARRLLRLVNQLLDFQKIEAGKRELKLSPMNVVQFAAVCGDYFSAACRTKGIDFSVLLNDQPLSPELLESSNVFIAAEADALEKVIFNFLSNALKYTPEGGAIALNVLTWPDRVRIAVTDTGQGISEEGQAKLFEVFGQLHDSDARSHEGTGLGLALTKNLSLAMGGDVGVESKLGEGSTFYSMLPRIPAPKERLDLLLVDDDPAIRKLIQSIMRRSDVIETVQTVSTAGEVRMVLKERSVGCILSDYILKGEDGISLLRDAAKQCPDTMRVLITGHMLEDEVQKAMSEGTLHQVFYKPVDNGELLRVIENLVRETRTHGPGAPGNLDNFQVRDWLVSDTEVESRREDPAQDPVIATNVQAQDMVGRGEKILVIDDLTDMRELIANTLKRQGYNVVMAQDGLAGLQVAIEESPALVVTDWMMPRLTGPGLIKQMRASGALSGIPIILLTAKSDQESKLIGSEIGADAFLGKPFNEQELLSVVRNLLRLKEREEEAITQSRYLAALFEAMTGGLILLEPDGAIRDLNSHIANLLGYSCEELTGRRFIDLLSPSDILRVTGIDSFAETEGQLNVGFATKDDRLITLQLDPSPLRTEQGDLTGYLLTLHNREEMQELLRRESVQLAEVTEAREMFEVQARELKAAMKLLTTQQRKLLEAQKLASLGSMVAGVAHELNTPVGTGLTATTHILPKAKQLQEQLRTNSLSKQLLLSFIQDSAEGLELIETNLSRAAELIRTFKQVSTNETHVETETVQLESYLNDVIASLSETLEACPHRIEVSSDPSKTELQLESVSLGEVIKKLVLNATTHAYQEHDPTPGTITLSVERAEAGTHIVIRDDGCGIPETDLPKIFEPFFTTSKDTNQTGLGLNIAHNLVTQRLGGTIECQTEVGHGTAFIISIPS